MWTECVNSLTWIFSWIREYLAKTNDWISLSDIQGPQAKAKANDLGHKAKVKNHHRGQGLDVTRTWCIKAKAKDLGHKAKVKNHHRGQGLGLYVSRPRTWVTRSKSRTTIEAKDLMYQGQGQGLWSQGQGQGYRTTIKAKAKDWCIKPRLRTWILAVRTKAND